MSTRKLGPEAKIIALFSALPEESRRIVFDLIRNQMATPRKAREKKKTAVLEVKKTFDATQKPPFGATA